jgi:L-malate glycosyltransferase
MNSYICATGPYGFAGAGRAMVQYLHALANDEALSCNICTHRLPFALIEDRSRSIHWISASAVQGDAIGVGRAVMGPAALASVELANAIVASACRARTDLVIIWAHYLFPYADAGALAISILRRRGIACRFIVTPCGSDVWQIAPQLDEVMRSACLLRPTPEQIIVYSRRFLEEVLAVLGPISPAVVIPPAIDATVFRPNYMQRVTQRQELGIPEDAFVVISHSNMRPVKRVDQILAAAHAFCKVTEKETHLLLVGPADVTVEKQGGLTTHRLGLCSHMELLLPAADVFLNLSFHDSFNIAAAEAMSCELPVVTTDVIGLLDYVSEPEYIGGIIDSSLTLEELVAEATRSLVELEASPERRKMCGEHNRRLVEQMFTPERIRPLLRKTLLG